MAPLPKPLVGHLARLSIREQGAAWFCVDASERVSALGGALASYGLSYLRRGKPLGTQAPFLDGVEREDGRYTTLPLVQLTSGRYADVHVVPHEGELWVLMLDATERAVAESAKQQHGYDLALALEESRKRDLADAMEALGVLVLRRLEPGRFEALGSIPEWARRWIPDAEAVRPVEAWPFLEDYLQDAEPFWATSDGTIDRWGPWLETAPSGEELHLEARAVRSAKQGALLLVQRLGEDLREKQTLIQRAREQQLEHVKKNVLLHCIVHDLNNPLTAIMGSLGLLASGVTSMQQVRSLADTALRQARRQARLVHDIMDVFSADVGALRSEGRDERVDVAACARDAAEEYAPAFARKRIACRLDVATASDEAEAQGAAQGLFRVFGNLLENAHRHTPRDGAVAIRVARIDGEVVACVENDGEPVPSALRERLFDKFTRSGDAGGLAGLGLFFCRMTLRRWGGDIEYEEREEGGSRFRCRLPAASTRSRPTAS